MAQKAKIKTQHTDKEVQEAIKKARVVKTPILDETPILVETPKVMNETSFNSDVRIEGKLELQGVDIREIILAMNEKINKIILILVEPKHNNQTKLSEMSLSDLNYLKEMLNRNITMNNYQGGDMELKIKSNSLIVKIMDEINNRIKIYE